MNQFQTLQPSNSLRQQRSVERYPKLLLAIKIFFFLSFGYCLYHSILYPEDSVLSALIIIIAALVPGYLWADGRIPGLPILPLHVLALIWTFALPLMAGHPLLKKYDEDQIIYAAMTVVTYAIVATISWYLISRRRYKPRKFYYILSESRGFNLFIASLMLGGIFTALVISRDLNIDPSLFGILRAAIISFASIAMFVLAYRAGKNEINRLQKIIFFCVALFYIVMQMSSLYLIGAVTCISIAIVGYTVGKQRVPWLGLIATFLVFSVFHAGKAEIRERYLFSEYRAIEVADIPRLLDEWTDAGFRTIFYSDEVKNTYSPIYQRTSLIHLLLFVQHASPRYVPYLEGATYVIVPQLLIPRFLNPNKPPSHLGTTLLNMHYGIQREEYARTTTIGWGLLNESYANFGLLGVMGLACFMGTLLGVVGRLTAGAPIMSFENLIGITFTVLAIQTEFSMGVFMSVLVQSLAVLVLVIPILKRQNYYYSK